MDDIFKVMRSKVKVTQQQPRKSVNSIACEPLKSFNQHFHKNLLQLGDGTDYIFKVRDEKPRS